MSRLFLGFQMQKEQKFKKKLLFICVIKKTKPSPLTGYDKRKKTQEEFAQLGFQSIEHRNDLELRTLSGVFFWKGHWRVKCHQFFSFCLMHWIQQEECKQEFIH